MRREIKNIVIHTSQSSWGSAEAIEKWHKYRGWVFTHEGVEYHNGYHFIVQNGYKRLGDVYDASVDGRIECSRPIELPGGVFQKRSWNSVEICLIGNPEGAITNADEILSSNQIKSLVSLLDDIKSKVSNQKIDIFGDSDLRDNRRYCPGFDVKEFLLHYT